MQSIPGINMDEGLQRTGGCTTLYLRFLQRFPEDPSFMLLRDALDSVRMHDAFICAHTLKGLTAQLGITALHAPMCILCEALRSKELCQLPIARKQFLALVPVYEEIVRQIRELP